MRGVQIVHIVRLGVVDREMAAQVGAERARLHRGQFEGKWQAPHYKVKLHGGSFKDFIRLQIVSAAAEIAVARYFRLDDYQADNKSFKQQADVGQNIEVKYNSRTDGDLLIRPKDRDDDYAVLVSGTLHKLCIVGYMQVKLAKIEANLAPWLQGCYIAHWQDLRDMRYLTMREGRAYESSNTVQAL